MYLSSLHLQHFRSYSEKKITFNNGLTFIVGKNGKGKTNILEAINALSTIKPFRAHKKEIFIEHGSSWAKIEGIIEKHPHRNERLSLFWGETPSFQAKINDVPCASAKQYLEEKQFSTILFSPEDLFLPFLSPSHRRNLLSRILSPLHADYFSAMLWYEKALKNRNALLKQKKEHGNISPQEFVFWEEKLSEYHDCIMQKHIDFFSFINANISHEYEKITGKNDAVTMHVHYSAEKGSLQQLLEQNRESDVAKGSTSVGIHRDDFMWYLRGLAIEESASRGEMRSVLLAFKKMQQRYTETIIQAKPVILLDDVFSELDLSHQEHLLTSWEGYQCIISATEVHISTQNATMLHWDND